MSINARPHRGWIARVKDGYMDDILIFQYNPTDDTTTVTPQYGMIDPPGSPMPSAVFKSMASDTFSLRLLLDATESWEQAQKGILADRAFLESLARPEAQAFVDGLGQFVSPPEIKVGLGDHDVWDGVVTSYSCQVTRRTRALIPVRAFVTLSIKAIYVGADQTQAKYQQLIDDRNRL